MKKTITKLAIALSFATTVAAQAQSIVTFDTYTLSPNTYYQDNAGTDLTPPGGVKFEYGWNTAFGGYWESGTAYTNLNDTVNGSYTNLYGAITGSAFLGNNYATAHGGSVISFTNNTTAIAGFYITNTTYVWKTIKNGDSFSRKFGDTTGTGSGTSIAQGAYPDWFKVLVRGYRNGALLTDSIEFFLADYRFASNSNDYVLNNWQFVNCIALGQVDSINVELKSSDVGSFGMNTPAFFSMDNFATVSTVGIKELSNASNISLFPNPAKEYCILNYESANVTTVNVSVADITGKEVQQHNIQTVSGTNQLKLTTEALESGVYFVTITDNDASKTIKLIKL
ncbi:MAG: DUF4465 domain-containing protein [Bacteroidota bacterium]